jgi:hypothetical protein
MDGASFSRVHWRLRGAWMWPAFIVFTVFDGVMLHELPVVGDSATLPGALILAFIINLIVIIVVGPTLGALLRRLRGDMPRVVSSDYAGACAVVIVAIVIVAGGLIHHPVVTQDHNAEADAVLVAKEYMTAKAPDARAYDLHTLDVLELEPPARSRVCAYNWNGHRWYCLAVTVPVGGGAVKGANYDGARVSYAGSESNAVLSEGLN